jgi:NADH-quinone oxidoreductase subunit K
LDVFCKHCNDTNTSTLPHCICGPVFHRPAAALSRRHAIFILIGIEMMLAAANLNFIAFWRFAPLPHPPTGVMITIFSIAISAAEAAVGLAMVIAVYRHYRTTNVDQYDQLKG